MSENNASEDKEFAAEFYDISYSGRKDIDFFVNYSLGAKGKTLELGCGTGRVLIPTAMEGCEITGLEISPLMLRRCQEKVEQQPEQIRKLITLIQGNMTEFNIGEKFPLVTTPFRSFQHLISTEEQKACLHCINEHLEPGGLLILDLFNPFLPRLYDTKYEIEEELTPESELPDGRRLRCTTRTLAFHRDGQYNEVEIIYCLSYPDGRTEKRVHSFPLRYFFRYEVEHLLNLSGFRIKELFGDFECSRFCSDSPEMIFVAEKR
ncbi:MAG: class I SAM-dependent methyltransferase [Deltaproteobacteria bacterium]|nr:MAG: class I SAM-dependent methyltransferase [Deltaproteobacteria bacterium]